MTSGIPARNIPRMRRDGIFFALSGVSVYMTIAYGNKKKEVKNRTDRQQPAHRNTASALYLITGLAL